MGVCVQCVSHTLSTGELGAESAGTGIPRTSERVSAVPSSSQPSRPRAFRCHERLRRRGSQAWDRGQGGGCPGCAEDLPLLLGRTAES